MGASRRNRPNSASCSSVIAHRSPLIADRYTGFVHTLPLVVSGWLRATRLAAHAPTEGKRCEAAERSRVAPTCPTRRLGATAEVRPHGADVALTPRAAHVYDARYPMRHSHGRQCPARTPMGPASKGKGRGARRATRGSSPDFPARLVRHRRARGGVAAPGRPGGARGGRPGPAASAAFRARARAAAHGPLSPRCTLDRLPDGIRTSLSERP